jgi:hypothetical protein
MRKLRSQCNACHAPSYYCDIGFNPVIAGQYSAVNDHLNLIVSIYQFLALPAPLNPHTRVLFRISKRGAIYGQKQAHGAQIIAG